MTEEKVGFLFKAASVISSSNNNVQNILKNFYLLKCREATKGYGLPQQQFSQKLRCQRCFNEWSNAKSKVVPLKLSKNQRRRIRIENKKRKAFNREVKITNGNKLETTCGFCGNTTTTYLSKPDKNINKDTSTEKTVVKEKPKIVKKTEITTKQKQNISVYSTSKEVFSLKSHNNTLQSTLKEKVIKNNKKKKDKFAGLCQKAVLSAAKLKSDKDKQNKINMFLKPSL